MMNPVLSHRGVFCLGALVGYALLTVNAQAADTTPASSAAAPAPSAAAPASSAAAPASSAAAPAPSAAAPAPQPSAAASAPVPMKVPSAAPEPLPASEAAPTAPTTAIAGDAKQAGPAAGAQGGPPKQTGPSAESASPAVEEAPSVPKAPLSAHYFVGLTLDTMWNRDAAWDYFSQDDLDQHFGLTAMWDALEVGNSVLALEMHLLGGSASASFGESLVSRASIEQTDWGLGAHWRYALASFIAPYARVAGGASFIDTNVAFGDSRVKADDTNFYGTASVGLALFSGRYRVSDTRARANSVAGALMVDAGYRFDQTLQFEVPEIAVGAADEGGQRVRAPAVPLGDLTRSGAYLRVSLLANF